MYRSEGDFSFQTVSIQSVSESNYLMQILMNVLKIQTVVLRHVQIQLEVTPVLVTLAIT